jgi:hypothetical protein
MRSCVLFTRFTTTDRKLDPNRVLESRNDPRCCYMYRYYTGTVPVVVCSTAVVCEVRSHHQSPVGCDCKLSACPTVLPLPHGWGQVGFWVARLVPLSSPVSQGPYRTVLQVQRDLNLQSIHYRHATTAPPPFSIFQFPHRSVRPFFARTGSKNSGPVASPTRRLSSLFLSTLEPPRPPQPPQPLVLLGRTNPWPREEWSGEWS